MIERVILAEDEKIVGNGLGAKHSLSSERLTKLEPLKTDGSNEDEFNSKRKEILAEL
jgi:hypothetical protein